MGTSSWCHVASPEVETDVHHETNIGDDVEEYHYWVEVFSEEGDGNRKNYHVADKKQQDDQVPEVPGQ